MKRLIRHSRLALLVGLLALGGMVLVASPAPAAHAGSPSITASGYAGGVYVHGTGFTPKGKVLVEVYFYNSATKTWSFESTLFVKASSAGKFNASPTSEDGQVRVKAQDLASGVWSNTVTTYAYPIT